jgi:hypothetical protein
VFAALDVGHEVISERGGELKDSTGGVRARVFIGENWGTGWVSQFAGYCKLTQMIMFLNTFGFMDNSRKQKYFYFVARAQLLDLPASGARR